MAYNIIAENEDYTIVSDYQTIYRKSEKYQSEAQLEKELIKTLTEQGYEYLPQENGGKIRNRDKRV